MDRGSVADPRDAHLREGGVRRCRRYSEDIHWKMHGVEERGDDVDVVEQDGKDAVRARADVLARTGDRVVQQGGRLLLLLADEDVDTRVDHQPVIASNR